MMHVGQTGILNQAHSLWQAKNYSGSGAWLDEIGSADFQLGSTSGSDTNDPLWLPHSTSQNPFGAGVDYTYSPGSSGNYVSTPDTAALDITGDISFTARVTLSDWASGTTRSPIGKWDGTGNQRAYWFVIVATGELRISTSTNGVDNVQNTSTTTTGFANNSTHWIAGSLDVNDGSGNRVAKFWISDTDTNDPDSCTWTQLGSTVTTAGTTTIFNSTAALTTHGLFDGATNPFTGSIARAQVYSGVRDFSTNTGGTLVADYHPNGGTVNSVQTSLTGTGDGLTWTLVHNTAGVKLAYVNEDKFLLGTDDYFTTPNNALFNFGTSNFSAVVVYRSYATLGASNEYWLAKRVSGGNAEGWALLVSGSLIADRFVIDANSTSDNDILGDVAWTAGQRRVLTGTRGTDLNLYSNTTTATPLASTPRNGDNTEPLYIGRYGTAYVAGEITAAAIFDRELTADEVAQVVSELA